MKQHFSVYFTPSYKVTPEILVYGKVAYHHAKAEYNDSYPGEGFNSISMNGFGFGGGVAYAITPNMEIGLEVQQVNFQRKQAALSNSKPSITEYNLIGKYRF